MKIQTKLGIITLLVPVITFNNLQYTLAEYKGLSKTIENRVNSSVYTTEELLQNLKLRFKLDYELFNLLKGDDFNINIRNDSYITNQIEVHSENFNISDQLRNKIQTVISAYSKDVSFYGISIDGKISFGYNPDSKYSCASSIKAPYTLYCYKQIESGQARYDDIVYYNKANYSSGTGIIKNSQKTAYTLEELLYNTIYYSDNIAYNMLYKNFGVDGYNKMLEELDCSYLQLTPYSEWGFASPREMVIVWQEIYNYKDTETGSKFFNTLLNAQYNFLKSSPLPYEVAHKSGWSTRGYNDHGIIFAKTPYIISVMMPYPNDKDQDQKYFKEIVTLCDEIMNEYNSYLESCVKHND